MILFLGNARCPSRDFESFFLNCSLAEDDIQLIIKHFKLKIVTYKLPPPTFSIKENSEVFTPRVIMIGPYKLIIMIIP